MIKVKSSFINAVEENNGNVTVLLNSGKKYIYTGLESSTKAFIEAAKANAAGEKVSVGRAFKLFKSTAKLA